MSETAGQAGSGQGRGTPPGTPSGAAPAAEANVSTFSPSVPVGTTPQAPPAPGINPPIAPAHDAGPSTGAGVGSGFASEPAPAEPASTTGSTGAASDSTASHIRGFINDLTRMAIVVVLALAARSSLLDHYVIPSGSMIPTLMLQDRVVVLKAFYGLRVPFTTVELLRFTEPARGDVMVFSSPTDGTTFIKRVVAVPGDVIAVRSGRLILNGEPVPLAQAPGERWPLEMLPGKDHQISLEEFGGPDFGPKTVPADSYLMIGDNRGNSQDSRSWGFLSRDRILGKAVRIYYRPESDSFRFDWFRWAPM
jgi:signal peptidase I